MTRRTLAQATSLYYILPLVALIFAAALLVEAGMRAGGRKATAARICLAAMLVGYLGIYVWLTILYRKTTAEPQTEFRLFWSYREAFSFEGGLHIARLGVARQILLNILVYVPLGLLLPIAFRSTKRRWLWPIPVVLALSLATELTQYLTHRGLCEPDDVFHNLLGCLLGMGMLCAGTRAMDLFRRRRRATDEPAE